MLRQPLFRAISIARQGPPSIETTPAAATEFSMNPPQITFGKLRNSGVRGILIYCADFHCSHSIAMNVDRRPDDLRLSDIEPRFICQACGKRGADVRPKFSSAEMGIGN
jgi:hypothetical protein